MDRGRTKSIVVYQGQPGAYSSIAAHNYFPKYPARGLPTFDDVIKALKKGAAHYALLPIENSTSGRVADMHHLLPGSGLHIIGEHFLPVRHCLIAYKGTRLKDVRHVYSHREALGQCRQYLSTHKMQPVPYGDTAGAVAYIAEEKRTDIAALASQQAALLHPDAIVLAKDVNDDPSNVTRFLVLARQKSRKQKKDGVITSIVYKTRDIPAALFKSLAGFATTGTNIIKLESFVPMTRHTDAHFYLEFEGNPAFFPHSVAIEELAYYARSLEILGTYEKSPYRRNFNGN
jgi:prephenate dehydratase